MTNTIINEHIPDEKDLAPKKSKQIWLKELEESARQDIYYHSPLLLQAEEDEEYVAKAYHHRNLLKAFWIIKKIQEEAQEGGIND